MFDYFESWRIREGAREGKGDGEICLLVHEARNSIHVYHMGGRGHKFLALAVGLRSQLPVSLLPLFLSLSMLILWLARFPF